MVDLFARDYVPTHADHAFMLRHRGWTTASTLSAGSISINLFDPTIIRRVLKPLGLMDRLRKLFCLAFVFDLTSYDVGYPFKKAEELPSQHLQRVLEIFGEQKEIHPGLPILLFLVNSSDFARKLVDTPLSLAHPLYTGEDSPEAGIDYILGKFVERKGTGTLYCHVCDVLDASNLSFLFAAVKDIVITEKLRGAGIPEPEAKLATTGGPVIRLPDLIARKERR